MPQILLTGRGELNPLLPFLPGFRDDFNRPDGPLIADNAGRPWVSKPSNGTTPGATAATLVVKDGAATVVVPDGATGNLVSNLEGKAADGVLTAVLKTKANQAGSLFIRGDGNFSLLELCLRESSTLLRPALFSRVAGSREQVGSAAPAGSPAVHDGSRFDIVFDGPSIVVYHDSVPIIAAESTNGLSRTKAGILSFSNGPGVAWDSIRLVA